MLQKFQGFGQNDLFKSIDPMERVIILLPNACSVDDLH